MQTGRCSPLVALVLLLVLGAAPAASAEVYYARDEALALAFPAGTTVEPRTAFLTDAQAAALGTDTAASKLFTYYRGVHDGRVIGYAVIDSHIVRTLPEAFMAVLKPDGSVDRVVMLAFYEPPEYAPAERWLEQFAGRRHHPAGDGWRVGRDVHGISGATLTANAMADAMRRIVLLYELVIRPNP